MTHDPALEAHEHTEHAEHAAHEGNPFTAKITITVAVLAVMAAAAGSLETVEGGKAITAYSEAVLAQDRATDAWNEYQADSLKRHMYDIAAQNGGPHTGEYQKESVLERDDQGKARASADNFEKQRDQAREESSRHEERHHWLTGAATLIEIGIALSTVAIITKRQSLWLGAVGLGATGAALFAAAYLT